MADETRNVPAPSSVAGVDMGAGTAGQRWDQRLPVWAQGAAGRVQAANFDPTDLSTGQVLGLAVGAATAVGGLVVALDPAPRAKEPPLPPPVERAIEALPKGRRRQARRAAARARREAEEARRRAGQAGQRAAAQVRAGAAGLGEN